MQNLKQDELKELMAKVKESMHLMQSAMNLDYYQAFIKEYDNMSKNVLEMKRILGLESKENRFVLACKILFERKK